MATTITRTILLRNAAKLVRKTRSLPKAKGCSNLYASTETSDLWMNRNPGRNLGTNDGGGQNVGATFGTAQANCSSAMCPAVQTLPPGWRKWNRNRLRTRRRQQHKERVLNEGQKASSAGDLPWNSAAWRRPPHHTHQRQSTSQDPGYAPGCADSGQEAAEAESRGAVSGTIGTKRMWSSVQTARAGFT